MLARDEDILKDAEDWRKAGRGVALATVVETWGSAPRPVGSNLVIDEEGNFLGSVSGGCVEGAVVTEAMEVIDSGKPRVLEFGVADETAWQVSGGAQVALGPVWRLGFALGYEHGALETDTRAKADGVRLNGGVALKYNPGPLLLTAAVSGGQGWYDTDRPIAFPGFSALAQADSASARLGSSCRCPASTMS